MRPVYRNITHDRSVSASLFGLEDDSFREENSAWGNAVPRVSPVKGPWALGFSPRLRQILFDYEGDVVHTHGIFKHTSADAHWVARRRKTPYTVAPHGMLDPWALRRSRLKKKLASWWFESSHLRDAFCFHALCQSEADDIRRCGYRQPICIIPNGVDLPKLSEDAPRERTSAGAPKTLLFLGRIHPKKGLQELLEAWKQCFQVNSSEPARFRLIIAGWDDGGHEDRLQTWVSENGLGQSVEFVGPVFGESKTFWLRGADGFVLPSFSEGLPMSVLEAWSFGLPVLMTDQCHLPEGFANDAAIRVTTEPSSIANGLRQWMDSEPSELQRIGRNGLDLVTRSFTWQGIASQYLAMYEWMLGGERPGFVDTI